MGKPIAYLFPGQGSQSVGMGYALTEKFSDYKEIFDNTLGEADEILGLSLSEIIKNGPAEKLKETEVTQPALLTVSTAMGRWLNSIGLKSSMTLGHSLGEYSALVHAGAIEFSDALKIVQLRGRLMQNAVPKGEGGMAALVGAQKETAEKLCKTVSEKTGEVLEVSLINSPAQIVISGSTKAIDEAVNKAREFRVRRIVKLEVSGPFHCSLLKSAGERLRSALDDIQIKAPTIPVISNVTGKPESSPEEIRDNLVRQVYQTVLWNDCVQYASNQGIDAYMEVGSGSVLTGILKKILPDSACTALDTLESAPTA